MDVNELPELIAFITQRQDHLAHENSLHRKAARYDLTGQGLGSRCTLVSLERRTNTSQAVESM
jgi:hypothetical protein